METVKTINQQHSKPIVLYEIKNSRMGYGVYILLIRLKFPGPTRLALLSRHLGRYILDTVVEVVRTLSPETDLVKTDKMSLRCRSRQRRTSVPPWDQCRCTEERKVRERVTNPTERKPGILDLNDPVISENVRGADLSVNLSSNVQVMYKGLFLPWSLYGVSVSI